MNTNNSFLQAIKILIKESINSAPYNRTKQAMIVNNNGDNTYDIRFDGKLYTNIISYPNTKSLPLKHIVKVIIPNNQASQMYISAEGSPLIYYPVGSYYETSDTSFDPNDTWGGTWSSETITDDVIVEEGTSGIWTYRKWNNGMSECWCEVRKTTAFQVWASGIYYGTTYTGRQVYPTGLFIEEPWTNVALKQLGCDGWLARDSSTGGDATHTSSFYPLRIGSNPSVAYTVSFYAKGKWKAYTAPTEIYRWHRTA